MLNPYQIHNPLFHIANPTLDYNLTILPAREQTKMGLEKLSKSVENNTFFSHAIDIYS